MKKFYFFLMTTMSFFTGLSQIDSCFSKFALVAPSIDGITNDAAYLNWKTFYGTNGNNNIISFAAAWNNNYLYVAVKVMDQVLINDGPVDYSDDAVELYIDGNNSHGYYFDNQDRQYRINYNKTTLSGIGDFTGVLHSWAIISGGYSVEFAIPWTNLNILPGQLNYIDIGNADDDNGGNEEGQTFWSGDINNWQSNAVYGFLVCYINNTNVSNIQVTNLKADYAVLPNSVIPLYWTCTNTDSIDIEYAVNGSAIWTRICRTNASCGFYNLTIPPLSIGSTIQYRLTNVTNPSVKVITSNLVIANPSSRILLRSNHLFNIIAPYSEHLSADTTLSVLTKSYNQIHDSLNTLLINIVTVDIYPNLSEYHAAIGWPAAPDWVVGNAEGETNIKMVSPYNPGPTSNLSGMLGVISHELIHCFVHRIARAYPPIWLNEGTACYLLNTQAPSAVVLCNRILLLGGKPSIDTLNSSSFANIDGYGFAYTIAEFVATHFTHGKLKEFIASLADYSVLGFGGKIQFQNAWHQFLDDHYPCSVSSIHEDKNIYTLNVFPNPAGKHFNIESPPNFGKYDLQFYSIEGKLLKEIKEIQTADYNFDTTDLLRGIYILFIKNDAMVLNQKILIK